MAYTMCTSLSSIYEDLPDIEPGFLAWLRREKIRMKAGRPTYCEPLQLDPDYDPDYDYSDYMLLPTMEYLSARIVVPTDLPPMVDLHVDPPPPPPPAEPVVSNKRKGRPGRASDLNEDGRPNWLPTGWTFRSKIRANGKTKGVVDWEYTSPCRSTKFRSRSSVEKYLNDQQILLQNKGEDVGSSLQKRKSNSCMSL